MTGSENLIQFPVVSVHSSRVSRRERHATMRGALRSNIGLKWALGRILAERLSVQAPPAVLVVGRKRECALFFGKRNLGKKSERFRRRSREKKRRSDSVNLVFSILVAVKCPT
ncbi:hypothetical protein ALC60_13497 [Trachymyrmex zeteki]|uniref:Uncharacterized protein n=1 Tax=Mycetomoellerius zeteki TaxID=64791 RepID=A0A151WI24_9HYME|nr:hypothetical protein ALC60_13497 [Trachymyrmex zeteki]